MTENKRLFLTISKELASVNDVLKRMANVGKDGLSLDELFVLSDFCLHYFNTTAIIEKAEELAHEDAIVLQQDASELLKPIECFLNIFPPTESDLCSIDVRSKLDIYDKEQAQPYNEERERAQSLWKQLSLARRVFDATTPDEDDYEELDETVFNLEQQYIVSHTRVNDLYRIYREKQTHIAHLYYFDGNVLVMLVAQLGDIARSVVRDIDNLRKEGRV